MEGEKNLGDGDGIFDQPSSNSERVVVDEIIDDTKARILRARFQPTNNNKEIFSIENWGDEKEDFIDAWRLEAFAGFPSARRLKEGDVFFIRDGRTLNNSYKPISRESAKEIHLLITWEGASRIARDEIKKQYYKLAASQMAAGKRERNSLLIKVEKKFKQDL